MELKPLLKEWRVWLLLLSLGVSLVFLGPHYKRTDSGDLTVATGIQKGLELKGGLRVLLDVQGANSENVTNQVKNVLQTRVSAFGLTQTDIRTVRLGDDYRIQVEVADTNRTRLQQLISREGSFEARMPLPVKDERYFNLSQPHRFVKQDSTVTVDGTAYQPGDSFTLEGTRFYYINSSDTVSNLEVVAYDGEDIVQVNTGSRNAGVSGGPRGYQFQFTVTITKEAARNVLEVSRNYEPGIGRNTYLRLDSGEYAMLDLYVDEERASSLRMSSVFARKTVTTPSISGGAETASQARSEMKELQAILRSGQLPAPVEIDSISSVSSSLGEEFASAAFISIIAALVAVGGLVYVRYRRLNVAVPIFLTGSSEVFILIGAWFSTVATLDLASIAGIIAAVGTGVDDQIIIADESGRERVRSWSKRMKRAFFVIFTSAASTIGAMSPLVSPELAHLGIGLAGAGLITYTISQERSPQYLVIGSLAVTVAVISNLMNPSGFALQAVRGFAITTILGVVIGIAITRPAYAKVLEHLEK